MPRIAPAQRIRRVAALARSEARAEGAQPFHAQRHAIPLRRPTLPVSSAAPRAAPSPAWRHASLQAQLPGITRVFGWGIMGVRKVFFVCVYCLDGSGTANPHTFARVRISVPSVTCLTQNMRYLEKRPIREIG